MRGPEAPACRRCAVAARDVRARTTRLQRPAAHGWLKRGIIRV